MRIGIFSGSFNPVHRGHVALSRWFVSHGVVDAVWLVRSPLNPLKADRVAEMASDAHRLAMLRLAIEGCEALSVCTVEDDMPRPNYSIHTLHRLRRLHPQHDFHFIIGSDNWQNFRQWYRWQDILRDFCVVVYPRPEYAVEHGLIDFAEAKQIVFASAPTYEVSSTDVRRLLRGGDEERARAEAMLSPAVAAYIRQHHLYGC